MIGLYRRGLHLRFCSLRGFASALSTSMSRLQRPVGKMAANRPPNATIYAILASSSTEHPGQNAGPIACGAPLVDQLS